MRVDIFSVYGSQSITFWPIQTRTQCTQMYTQRDKRRQTQNLSVAERRRSEECNWQAAGYQQKYFALANSPNSRKCFIPF